jgi:acyl carrier protein
MEIENIQFDPISTNAGDNSASRKGKDDSTKVKKLPTQVEIKTWIVNYVAEILEVKPDRIDITISFDRYGLDSSAAVELAGDLEDWLDQGELDPTLLYDYPTIEALTQHLIKELKIRHC